MKKQILFSLALVALTQFVFAQTNLKEENINGLSFLQVVVGNESTLGKSKMAVSYGNSDLMEVLTDENGKKFYFNNWAPIFEYFDKQGWSYFKDVPIRMNGASFDGMIFKRK